VHIGLLIVTISGIAAGWSLWEEIKFNPTRRESGHIIFFKQEGITATRYTFYDATLVDLKFLFDGRGTAGKQTAVGVELHFSAATIEVHGIRIENYSLIPWPTSPATSFKALTKPADPLPSAHLAAGLAVLGEKVGEGIVGAAEKALPIAGEGVARTISLLPALLLITTEGKDDPGYASEWEMYRRNNHPVTPIAPPPTPEKVRLAQLERALEAQTLTAQEEAELIILLARVKGIFVNQLADLTPEQQTALRPPKLDPTKKPLYAPVISKWYQKGGTIEVLPNGNWMYTDWLGNSVVYEGDEPNFDPYARQEVDIDNMQGECTSDFAKANKNGPLGPRLPENTWHHKHNMKTMQEVPYEIHKRFTHYGARSMMKQAGIGAHVAKKATFRKK
jgi:hypothetical protein